MQTVYLSRRNLKVLLSKLDRVRNGESSAHTIIKQDTKHPVYPCTDIIEVIAVEDADYYTDRKPGYMYPEDEPK